MRVAPRRNGNSPERKQIDRIKKIRKRMPPPTKVHRPTKKGILDRAEEEEARREIEDVLLAS